MQLQHGQKAIFLDRDGVLNYDPGDYTKSVLEFTVLPTVIETLQKWALQNYIFIVITNQAGIAKNLYTHAHVNAIHQYFNGLCIANGFAITDFYYCPHHPQYTGNCLCRKPGGLLIQKALHKHKLQPQNCLIIGDKQRDLEAAASVNVKGILIPTNADIADVKLPF